MIDKELTTFLDDVYDVLSSNDHLCTQQEFFDKYVGDKPDAEIEINLLTCTITCGKFRIEVSKVED